MKWLGNGVSILVLACLTACQNPLDSKPEDSEKPSSVTGQVRFESELLPGVEVTLIGSTIKTTSTDDKGMFSFSKLSEGSYTIVATKAGFSFGPTTNIVVQKGSSYGVALTASLQSGYVLDSWGILWDVVDRPRKTWADANAIAQSVGGRLPTASEIYRVGLNGTAQVAPKAVGAGGTTGPAPETETYWTNLIWDGTVYTHGSFKTGKFNAQNINVDETATTLTDAKHPFFIVYPLRETRGFTDAAVMKMPGSSSQTIKIFGQSWVVDSMDRPELPWSVAVREADFYGAYLPSTLIMAALINSGLPNGSGDWLHTSDYTGTAGGGPEAQFHLIKWSGTFDEDYDLTASTTISASYANVPRAFRLIGLAKDFEKPAPPEINDYLYLTKHYFAAQEANNLAIKYTDAIKNSFADGYHLPSAQELFLQKINGLPDDSANSFLWFADLTATTAAGVTRWIKTDRVSDLTYSRISDTAITNTYKYKKVLFDIDQSYKGPPVSVVAPNKLLVINKTLANGQTASFWIDNEDQSPLTLIEATTKAYKDGAVIPRTSDFVEFISSGLPNGSNIYLWTNDFVDYDNLSTVRWTGTGSASTFDLLSGTTLSSTKVFTSTLPYRRMWTNELRAP